LEDEMTGKKDQIIIFGCGGHARSVADVVISNKKVGIRMFVDENAGSKEILYGCHVVRQVDQIDSPYIFAIGDNEKRKAKYDEVGISQLTSVISKRAYVGYGSRIGRGCFLANICHVGPEVEVGENTIINTASVIEHEVTIGKHCHVAPGAVILGRCLIGDLVFVGAGAVVREYVSICSNVIIGAGATVTSDIEEPGIYVGTPALRIS